MRAGRVRLKKITSGEKSPHRRLYGTGTREERRRRRGHEAEDLGSSRCTIRKSAGGPFFRNLGGSKGSFIWGRESGGENPSRILRHTPLRVVKG